MKLQDLVQFVKINVTGEGSRVLIFDNYGNVIKVIKGHRIVSNNYDIVRTSSLIEEATIYYRGKKCDMDMEVSLSWDLYGDLEVCYGDDKPVWKQVTEITPNSYKETYHVSGYIYGYTDKGDAVIFEAGTTYTELKVRSILGWEDEDSDYKILKSVECVSITPGNQNTLSLCVFKQL